MILPNAFYLGVCGLPWHPATQPVKREMRKAARQGRKSNLQPLPLAGPGLPQGSSNLVARATLPSSLQDFETNDELKCKVISFLEEVMHDPELLTQERKAAANIIR